MFQIWFGSFQTGKAQPEYQAIQLGEIGKREAKKGDSERRGKAFLSLLTPPPHSPQLKSPLP